MVDFLDDYRPAIDLVSSDLLSAATVSLLKAIVYGRIANFSRNLQWEILPAKAAFSSLLWKSLWKTLLSAEVSTST